MRRACACSASYCHRRRGERHALRGHSIGYSGISDRRFAGRGAGRRGRRARGATADIGGYESAAVPGNAPSAPEQPLRQHLRGQIEERASEHRASRDRQVAAQREVGSPRHELTPSWHEGSEGSGAEEPQKDQGSRAGTAPLARGHSALSQRRLSAVDERRQMPGADGRGAEGKGAASSLHAPQELVDPQELIAKKEDRASRDAPSLEASLRINAPRIRGCGLA